MLHVAVTSCPQLLHPTTVRRVAWSWRTCEQGTLPVHPPSPRPPSLLPASGACLIFPSENKTLTTSVSLEGLVSGPLGDAESAEVITTSSRGLVSGGGGGVIAMLAFDKLYLVSSAVKLEFLS